MTKLLAFAAATLLSVSAARADCAAHSQQSVKADDTTTVASVESQRAMTTTKQAPADTEAQSAADADNTAKKKPE